MPDTQEVFLSPDSDVSYIIEILEQVEGDNCDDVARSVSRPPASHLSTSFPSPFKLTLSQLDRCRRFHFSSLAHDNSAVSSSVLSIAGPSSTTPTLSSLPQSPPNQPPLIKLKGTQQVAKFNKEEQDEVCIFMGVWRVGGKSCAPLPAPSRRPVRIAAY